MSIGTTMLGRRHVQPSVVASLSELMVEGTFPTGTYLVTVHHPISSDDGDLEKALYGSFLPIPPNDMFPLPEATVYGDTKQPGAVVAVKGEAGTIKLNEGRKRISLKVKSMGDRPIQACLTSRTSGVNADNATRLVPTTTSSKQIHNYNSIAYARTATDSIFPPAHLYVSNLATQRRSRWSKLAETRSSRVETRSLLDSSRIRLSLLAL
jgi:hypothetical protein